MPRDKCKVEAALCSKGFELVQSHHNFFIYRTLEGKRTSLRTKTSHGSGTRSLGDHLLSQMARQCRLERSEFLLLIDCPLDQAAYEALLREAGTLQ